MNKISSSKPINRLLPSPNISPVYVDTSGWSWWKKIKAWRTTNRQWLFNKDWIVYVDYLKCWVKIPAGFVFDGASIPKILHFLLSPTGMLFYGAILHDFLYRFNALILTLDRKHFLLERGIGKTKSDEILYRFSNQTGAIKGLSKSAQWSLKLFGFIAWNKARKRNLQIKSADPDFDSPDLKGSFTDE